MMEIVESSEQLSGIINNVKAQGKTVGFVPTMGALHQGHISLVNKAAETCDFVLVSVFVNPTQFNNPDDLERYPRDLAKDLHLLKDTGCELVFAPTVKEIYPKPDTRIFDFGNLDKVMEGEHRPGHFNGVAQVVSRLFDITQPDYAFFGEKDFQQLAVIRAMVRQENFDVKIVPCPTIREEDGLAMSSRNLLLTPQQRKKAPIIARTLFESCNFVNAKSIDKTIEYVINSINREEELKVEYFEIADADTLLPIKNWKESEHIVGCIAVFAGEIRLIDNVIYKKGIS
ncbi:pantoate--beta-alanine ligase [Alkalitalea saponilacus]|nr:pantoate--beta-alanine ligase [Alkalitalea saponilacus]